MIDLEHLIKRFIRLHFKTIGRNDYSLYKSVYIAGKDETYINQRGNQVVRLWRNPDNIKFAYANETLYIYHFDDNDWDFTNELVFPDESALIEWLQLRIKRMISTRKSIT